MKVGIISFAHRHAYSYAEQLLKHSDVELEAVWDEDPDRGKRAADQFGCVFYHDLSPFLSTGLDAVIVCSENAKHKEHVIAAARAKLHILCEKPMSTGPGDGKDMIRVCNEENVVLQIAFPVRYSPAVIQLRNIIQSGQLGDIIAVNATNRGKMPGGWFINVSLAGGGAATDHIVHVMDIIRWVLNDEVERVYAELDTRFSPIEVEDCGIVLLEMASGIMASIDPSWSRPKTYPMWGDVTMEIVGTKGTMKLDIFKQSSDFYNDAQREVQALPWMDDLDESLIADFLQIVRSAGSASISGLDGLRALEVVKAAYQSHREQAFVKVNRS